MSSTGGQGWNMESRSQTVIKPRSAARRTEHWNTHCALGGWGGTEGIRCDLGVTGGFK